MPGLSNALLSGLRSPIPSLYHGTYTLLLNDRGQLLDISTAEFPRYPSVARQIKTAGNISGFFEWEGSLSRIAREGGELFGYANRFLFEDVAKPFYTTLPVLGLRLVEAARGKIVGILSFSDILLHFFETAAEGLLYVDSTDAIRGYNQIFLDYFGANPRQPGSFLGRPCGACLSPTPGELQSRGIAALPPAGEAAWTRLFERRFSKALFPETEFSEPHAAAGTDGGLRWESRPPYGEDGSYMALRTPAGFSGRDLRVKFTVESQDGEMPCVIFGDRKSFSDTQGYLIGPDHGNQRMVLKRKGIILGRGPMEPGAGGQQTVEVEKRGHAFFFSRNGKRLFQHLDFNPVQRTEAHLILYLRRGQACLLKDLTLWSRPSGELPPPPGTVVQARNAARNHFLLSRFDSLSLTSFHRDIDGYRLQDISDLQNRLKTLETQYLKQLKEGERLKNLLYGGGEEGGILIGKSKPLAILREQAERVAPSPTPLLIEGETGAGKEVLARFIHRHSALKEGPFVKVDCSVLPATLMESELFGHEKGAFTGAAQRKKGLFEQAEGGTLFLDEVGNLTLEAQAKLLQFLQDHILYRVGGNEPIKLSVRVVAAANRSLRGMTNQGAFREDLYFRIAVVTLRLPSLNERREDIPELCAHFLERFNREHLTPARRFSPAAFRALHAHPWPGNVRELKNAVERAALFCDGEEIEPRHLALSSANDRGRHGDFSVTAKGRRAIEISKTECLAMIRQHRGVVARAAEALGVTPRGLYYYFRKMGIDPNTLRKNPRRRSG